MELNILAWIVLGVIAGALVHFVIPSRGKYLAGTISAGVVGAFVGGVLYSAFKIGQIAVSFDPIASIIALLGAGILIYLIRVLIKNEEEFLREENKNKNLP